MREMTVKITASGRKKEDLTGLKYMSTDGRVWVLIVLCGNAIHK